MNKKGFTLVELLAVVVLLGLVIMLAATKGFGAFDNTKKAINKQNIKAIEEAARLVMIDIQECDDNLGDASDLNDVLGITGKKCDELRIYVKDSVEIKVNNMITKGYISGNDIVELNNNFPNKLYVNASLSNNDKISIDSSTLEKLINVDHDNLPVTYLDKNKFNSFISSHKSTVKEIYFTYNIDKNGTILSTDTDEKIYGWVDTSTGKKIIYIGSKGKIFAPSDCTTLFKSYSNLTKINFDNFDTSEVKSMNEMFSFLRNLIELNVTGFNTSKVTDMYGMFYNCSSLENLDLSSFDTSKVSSKSYMFGNWNTNSHTVYVKDNNSKDKFNSSTGKTSSITFVVK